MKNIDRFILHVVQNLFPLSEYSQGALNQILAHYKDEAEDNNIEITEPQLKRYIELFDKNKKKFMDKIGTDLVKPGPGGKLEVIVPLSTLMKLASGVSGSNVEEEDRTPDVVFPKQGDPTPQEGEPGYGMIVYNGSKEGNCIRYGQGEKWCITRGSYGSYRYRADKGYPTFYLAKNDNLPETDKNSFVAIQVRGERNERDRYVYTDRSNSPYESSEMSFEDLTSRVPWLREIPDLKNILKYIPLSSQEKNTQIYRDRAASIRDWIYFPNLDIKQQYLVTRTGKQKFNDISDERFVRDYLPDYPDLARFLAITPDVIDTGLLLQYLDKLPRNDQSSVVANLRSKVSPESLASNKLSFAAKQQITYKNKWNLSPDQKIYVTKDGQSVILLTLGDNIKIDRYTEEKDFPNIKLNQRTSKYLLDYPNLDEIPLKNLIKLAEDEVVDKEFIDRILNKAKEDPNSSLIVKSVDDGEIILDSNSFSSYKVGSDGKITSVPFDNEEVQQAINDAADNETFKEKALNLFKTRNYIPAAVDKKGLFNVINSLSYNDREFQIEGENPVVLLTSTSEEIPFYTITTSPTRFISDPRPQTVYNNAGETRGGYSFSINNEAASSYFDYLRRGNKSFSDLDLTRFLGNKNISIGAKKTFIRNNPPTGENNAFRAVISNDRGSEEIFLIDTRTPNDSFVLSSARNNLKGINIPASKARQLLGQAAPATLAAAADDQTRRRGRPAGQTNAPRPEQPAVADAGGGGGDIDVAARMGEVGLGTAFMRLPTSDRRRLMVTDGVRVNPNNHNGSTRRNNVLAGAGRVGQTIKIGDSFIYIIRLTNQQIVAFINVQPMNNNYLLTGNDNGNVVVPLSSPRLLLQALQQRNLAEVHQYIVNEYLGTYPEHLSEFKELLRKHINEKKKQEMNKNKLKEAIRQLVDKVLTEEITNSKSMSTARKIETDIESGKLDPAEVKAAAEKAEKGDSTDLAMLMLTYLQK
jgi:hypothetical protein